MPNISLTSSMRSNLLSLQQTSKLQDITQQRLASGLKVATAIDNPSSYYTAQSLNNRAADLTALLDAMGQGIQTLKAVTAGIEKGSTFLEQAKAVANQVLEKTPNIAARVSNEADLLAAIASGKSGLIVLENDIVISENQKLVLADGQSLVGAGYVKPGGTVPKLTFKMNGTANNGIEAGNSSTIAGLKIDYTTDKKGDYFEGNTIAVLNKSNVKIIDVNINYDNSTDNTYNPGAAIFNRGEHTNTIVDGNVVLNVKASNSVSGIERGYSHGILNFEGGALNIKAALSIKVDGSESDGILSMYNTNLLISDDAAVKIETLGSVGVGIYTYANSNTIIKDRAVVNILTNGDDSFGIANYNNSSTSFRGDAKVYVETKGARASGLLSDTVGVFNLSDNANVNILTGGYKAIGVRNSILNVSGNASITGKTTADEGDVFSGNTINIYDQGKLTAWATNTNGAGISSGILNMYGNSTVNLMAEKHVALGILDVNLLSSGATLNMSSPVSSSFMNVNLTAVNGATISNETGTHKYKGTDYLKIVMTSTSVLPADKFDRTGNMTANINPDVDTLIRDNWAVDVTRPETNIKTEDNSNYDALFSGIISQYDLLINDAGYKGVNLLKEQQLEIRFNEDRSSNVSIHGVDASSHGLGISTADWETSSGVNKSLEEIENAIGLLRSYASEYGSYYSIVETRNDFTQNLINVLTEGADKLVLADMNEESANMLALQTRQQLAVNSLSLASQASQSVLKLF